MKKLRKLDRNACTEVKNPPTVRCKNLRTIDCTRRGPAINIGWLVDFLTSLAEAIALGNALKISALSNSKV
jgi:hypothetical protein